MVGSCQLVLNDNSLFGKITLKKHSIVATGYLTFTTISEYHIVYFIKCV